MGIFKQPKAPPPNAELEKQMKERREEEERAKKEKDEKDEQRKWRKSQGMVGTRSLFAKAGGKGFYYEGKEV